MKNIKPRLTAADFHPEVLRLFDQYVHGDLVAAVPFYGPAPPLDQVAGIKATLLIHFADNDPRINAGWPDYERALKTAGVKYEAFTYPGTQHGFNNDTTPRYDEAAAKIAWQRTIAMFNRTLRAPAA